MRILFLTQVLPLPLDAGPKLRSYYVLRYLAEAGHEVNLLSFVRPTDRDAEIQQLSLYCQSVRVVPIKRSRVSDVSSGLQSLFSSNPFLVQRDLLAGMKEQLLELLRTRSFDAVHSDQLWTAPYGQLCGDSVLTVLDQHNAVFQVFRRMAAVTRNPLRRMLYQHESSKLEEYERRICKAYNRTVWVSEADRRAVRGEDGQGDPVIPIAVDPTMRQPMSRRAPFRVTFLGGMHWPPNAEGISWFVRKIWPIVAHAAPHAVLTIVGRTPPNGPGRNLRGERLEITGYVTELKDYLEQTAVFVVPLLSGAGMRVKILDAWSWALPVVSTTLGAEGLHAENGENLTLADSPATFADAVIRVLQNPQHAQRLSQGGRATIERYYDWRTVYQAWDTVYS